MFFNLKSGRLRILAVPAQDASGFELLTFNFIFCLLEASCLFLKKNKDNGIFTYFFSIPVALYNKLLVCFFFLNGIIGHVFMSSVKTIPYNKQRKGKVTKLYREPQSGTGAHFNSALPYLTRLLNSE